MNDTFAANKEESRDSICNNPFLSLSDICTAVSCFLPFLPLSHHFLNASSIHFSPATSLLIALFLAASCLNFDGDEFFRILMSLIGCLLHQKFEFYFWITSDLSTSLCGLYRILVARTSMVMSFFRILSFIGQKFEFFFWVTSDLLSSLCGYINSSELHSLFVSIQKVDGDDDVFNFSPRIFEDHMASSNNVDNNGGFLVYRRKRKGTSPEASKPFQTAVGIISINSNTSEAKADSNTPASGVARDRLKKKVEFDISGMEHHGGAPTSGTQLGSAMVQQTPKEVRDGKHLVVREVLQKSMEEEVDESKLQSNDAAIVQQLAPVHTPSGHQAMKEKFVELRKRQKRRLLRVKKERKEAHSRSRLVEEPKQRSDPGIFKREGPNSLACSSLISLKGKGITIPNASLQVPQIGSASGFPSNAPFNRSTLNSTTPPLMMRRPAGFLKRNTKPNDWSQIELDALWIGVRRYGQGNWERILTDQAGFIFKNKTPQDLSTRWNMELLKIMPPLFAHQQPTCFNNILNPTMSSSLMIRNGMMSSHHHFAPQGPLLMNVNPRPNVAGLMFQTFHHHQRADHLKMMEALQQIAPMKNNVAVQRNWFPVRPEPNNLKMDHGCVQFPSMKENKNNNNNNNNAGHRCDHPITVIGSDSEQDSSNSLSETTLSA
ncbi:uncharacterized protein LOC129314174 [Prosopis cineraria]|uniref:uncharacterized protein LOC129314174 n=1 Tax=Prosopis cineraria TaxID=364024 RepID=UPI00240EB542|nr:uncharacterized protein LOC129314174 [Prosopis cineraria]